MSFIVASAPAQGLDQVKALTQLYGGEYTAGEQGDKLNSVICQGEEWRTAWKGKTAQAIEMKSSGGQALTLVAISGGPCCDKERNELRNVFCKQYVSQAPEA